MGRPPIRCDWLRELAAGYLQAYPQVCAQQRGGLWGYFFERGRRRLQLGFFAGFLTRPPPEGGWRFSLPLKPPECVVLAFVYPSSSGLHRRLVRRPDSCFRRAYELLTKYTARRPRFELQEGHWAALRRHVPLVVFPPHRRGLYARNFFMETLALLVRTRLPEDLLHVRLGG